VDFTHELHPIGLGSHAVWPSRSKDYRVTSGANIGMADDMSLLLVPRDIITQVHKFLH
jgi:hypothetical protein